MACENVSIGTTFKDILFKGRNQAEKLNTIRITNINTHNLTLIVAALRLERKGVLRNINNFLKCNLIQTRNKDNIIH